MERDGDPARQRQKIWNSQKQLVDPQVTVHGIIRDEKVASKVKNG